MSNENQVSSFQYQILTTADGSPSLRLWKDNQPPEAMHHLGGALSETLYIYGDALAQAHRHGGELRVLSVGLGLGYNELLAAARSFEWSTPLRMESFESESELLTPFLNWLEDHHAPEPFRSVYERILELIGNSTGILPLQIKSVLADALRNGQWKPSGRLDQTTSFERPFNCIFFDAFSSGATPELWSEEFLGLLLRRTADTPCVFSTYAATGALRRALTAAGFKVELRPGFAGKRQSTFAVRLN